MGRLLIVQLWANKCICILLTLGSGKVHLKTYTQKLKRNGRMGIFCNCGKSDTHICKLSRFRKLTIRYWDKQNVTQENQSKTSDSAHSLAIYIYIYKHFVVSWFSFEKTHLPFPRSFQNSSSLLSHLWIFQNSKTWELLW